MINLVVNGRNIALDVEPEMPLLWALRDELGMVGTKFGCGAGLCGACTVIIDGQATRSCITPVSAAADKRILTIEGLGEKELHAVQKAWIEADAPQCGYCQSGQIMAAVALLSHNPHPTDADIDAEMSNICRCGTYPRMRAAVHRAAELDQDLRDDPMTIALSRRAFIRASLSAAGGLAIAAFAPEFAGATTVGGEPWSPETGKAPDEINAFVVIDPDNSVTLRVAKSDMGQGVLTSMAMILAEELECDFAKVKVEYASAHRNLVDNNVYQSMGTGGSRSVRSSRVYPAAGGRLGPRAAHRRGGGAMGRGARRVRRQRRRGAQRRLGAFGDLRRACGGRRQSQRSPRSPRSRRPISSS